MNVLLCYGGGFLFLGRTEGPLESGGMLGLLVSHHPARTLAGLISGEVTLARLMTAKVGYSS
jgi:hypothetical protein